MTLMTTRLFAISVMLLLGLNVLLAQTTAAESKRAKSNITRQDVAIPPLPVRKSKRVLVPEDKSSDKKAADADNTPEPDPNVWTEEEIKSAKTSCNNILKAIDAVAIPQSPVKKGRCGEAAPIRLVSVGRKPQISFSPPALVNCQMAQALHTWTTQKLQPLAKRYLKSPIVKVEVMVGYACRNRYGRKSGRLSEHATANALDIQGFVTANGKRTRLLAHWGDTVRDIVRKKEEEKAAKEAALAKAKLAQAEKDKRQAASLKQAVDKDRGQKPAKPPANNKDGKTLKKNRDAQVAALGKGDIKAAANKKRAKKQTRKLAKKANKPPQKKKKRRRYIDRAVFSPATSKNGQFLRQAHNAACRIFGTVLGPEANDAHRNHFHVDLAPRRRRNYCE